MDFSMVIWDEDGKRETRKGLLYASSSLTSLNIRLIANLQHRNASIVHSSQPDEAERLESLPRLVRSHI